MQAPVRATASDATLPTRIRPELFGVRDAITSRQSAPSYCAVPILIPNLCYPCDPWLARRPKSASIAAPGCGYQFRKVIDN
jgi:hypothetical protein